MQGVINIKKEYDFSKGEHGKFFNQDAELCLPVYLETDIAEFMRKIAGKKYEYRKISQPLAQTKY